MSLKTDKIDGPNSEVENYPKSLQYSLIKHHQGYSSKTADEDAK